MAKVIKKEQLRERLLDDNTPFAIKESFNALRTNLLYSTSEKSRCPVYAITSAGESVGKSTTIANLSISFAQIPKKVLLIDADMRCPIQNQIFNFPGDSVGLSELLSGIVSDHHEAIIHSEYSNLDILPSGHIPPNPSELIMSSAFDALLDKCRDEYDVIFIDCPPVGIVADAIALRNIVTGYILLVRSNVSDTRKVNKMIERMEHAGAKILGVVLNAVSSKGGNSSYYYKSHYSNYEKASKKK